MEAEQPRNNFIETIRQLEAGRDSAGLLALLDQAVAVAVRRAAAHSLARVAPAEFTPLIAERLQAEPDRGVRRSLARALGRLGDDRALPALLPALKDQDLMVREEAAVALSRFNSEAAFRALLDGLQHRQEPRAWLVRRSAAEALGRLGDRRAVMALITALRDEHDLVRPAAALALGQLGDRQATPDLKRARHTTPHRRGAECAECAAIDAALRMLAANQNLSQ